MISSMRQILRLMHINLVVIRHGLDEIILGLPLFRPVRFVARKSMFSQPLVQNFYRLVSEWAETV